MNLVNAIAVLAANPSTCMCADEGRVIGFNPKGTLINFARGPNAPAVLKLRDFMREDWEVIGQEEIARRAAELDQLLAQEAAAPGSNDKTAG